MAIKKEALDNFFEEELHPPKKPIYSSYRLFDEPSTTTNDDSKNDSKKLTKENKQSHNTTHNKPITQPITIGKQLENNQEEKSVTIGKQLENKVITEHITCDVNSNHKKRVSNSLSSLSGLPRKIVLAIYQNCKVSGSNTTSEITLDHLSSIVGCNKNCIKTTINRLRKKNFLDTVEYKTGRGGWVIYKLSQFIYLDILKNEGLVLHDSLLNGGINKWETQTITQSITDGYSSSSSSNIYKTTTNNELQFSIEWQNIDIEPLSEIGFTKNHLAQLAKQNILSPGVVKNSICAFAFDLKENGKRKEINGDPINYFMGILRKGDPYTPPTNYESPQERNMRLYKERMSEIESRKADIEKKSFDLAFNDWFTKLTDVQKIEFLPMNLRSNPRLENSKMLEGGARDYFTKEVWQAIKNKIEAGE